MTPRASQEKVIYQNMIFRPPAEVNWSREDTLQLIEFFRIHRPRVGTSNLRRMHELWELLAREMSKVSGTCFTAKQCENRWRVLERNYKKVVDNNRTTGGGRKTFEYERQMDEIFQKKANMNPPLLLAGHVVSQSPDTGLVSERPRDWSEPGPSQQPGPSHEPEPSIELLPSQNSSDPDSPSPPSKKQKLKKRPAGDEVDHRREYQKARLQMDRERIEGRERREERNLEVQMAILRSLEELSKHQERIAKEMKEQNELLRKFCNTEGPDDTRLLSPMM